MGKTEKYLKSLIENQIKESTSLEYKSREALENNSKIAKSISSMANSNGGTIIYGLICDKDQFPEKMDWINDLRYEEKIHQVLKSVNPKIKIEIELIQNSKNNKEFVILVGVPKSEDAPHQHVLSKEVRKYWARYGSTTREMEHYEIEGLFFRRKSPSLKIGLRDVTGEKGKPAYEIYLENVGKVVAEKTFIKLIVPSDFNVSVFKKTKSYPMGYSSYESILKDDLIYPGIKSGIGMLYSLKKIDFGMLKFNFTIVCKDMEVLEGEVLVACDGNQKIIYKQSKIMPHVMSEGDYVFMKDDPFIPKEKKIFSSDHSD